jgi:hypothetical protein
MKNERVYLEDVWIEGFKKLSSILQVRKGRTLVYVGY